MAGYQTLVKFRVEKHIKKEVLNYQKINKHRDRTSATEVEKRGDYMESIEKLFDIATPDLEEIIRKSRILGNDDECKRYRIEKGYTRKTEDISFFCPPV